jgi:rod shape determining protein RodA
MQNTNNSLFQRIDTKLLFVYLLLVLIGMSAVFSVEYRTTDVSVFLMHKSHMKQAIWLGVSLFVGMLILFTESKFFASFAYLGYALGLTLLVLTIFIGKDVKGSHSWLGIGSFAFQPGEVCKIFTALALAKFLSSPETNFNTWKYRMIGIGLALFPAILIILQKETGLALVYFSFFLVMYREGLPISILVIGLSLIVLTITTLLLCSLAMFIVLTLLAAIVAYLSWRDIKRNVTARGLLIGISQWWLAIPPSFSSAWKWIFVNMMIWMIAIPIGSTVGLFLHRSTNLFLGEVAGLAITWLLVAIFTGISAVKIIKDL